MKLGPGAWQPGGNIPTPGGTQHERGHEVRRNPLYLLDFYDKGTVLGLIAPRVFGSDSPGCRCTGLGVAEHAYLHSQPQR